jgi:hypothetical protein
MQRLCSSGEEFLNSSKKKCVAYPHDDFLFKIHHKAFGWLKTNPNQNYH